jgi:uncharacterized protein with ParB-like and HNH nuclease domain
MNDATYRTFVLNENVIKEDTKSLEELNLKDVELTFSDLLRLYREKRLSKKQSQQAVDNLKKRRIEEEKLKNRQVIESFISDIKDKIKEKLDSHAKNEMKQKINAFREKKSQEKREASLSNRLRKAVATANAAVSPLKQSEKDRFAERVINRRIAMQRAKGDS